MKDPKPLKANLGDFARSLGFERFGVTSAAALGREEEFLKVWLEAGRAGEMDYMSREPSRRAQPAAHLPSARSVISLAMNYFAGDSNADPTEGHVARYAWGKDYHKVIGKRLDSFIRYLEALEPESVSKTFVDTGPLLERAFAQRAGLGFVGKNTMLITRGLGSWVFLATVVTSVELPIDAPDERSCGECRLCIDACPTDAITEAYSLDARRCLSYLTIELDGPVPVELRDKNAGWVFGCDICQEVCPHNTRVPVSSVESFKTGTEKMLTLAEILTLPDEAAFRSRFAGTPLTRTGFEGLVRNACLAAGALGRIDLLSRLETLAQESVSPVIQEHALWAVEALNQTAQI